MFFNRTSLIQVLAKALAIVNHGEAMIEIAREQGFAQGYRTAQKEKFEAMTRNATDARIKPSVH